MKPPTPEAQCPEGIFQIQYPICAVNFTNNVSRSGITLLLTLQIMYQGQAEHDRTFENS